MSNPYRRPEWQVFRKEVLEQYEYTCRECGRTLSGGASLHVHHIYYIPGKMPWEYPYTACEVLCRGCHAEKHGKIMPSSGWSLDFEEDLEDLSGTCDVCETEIRYIFHIDHEQWEPLAVGTDCCDRMTGTAVASAKLKDLQRRASRRRTFVRSPRWERRKNELFIFQKGFNISIVPAAGGFQIRVNGKIGKKTFSAVDAAKRHLFNAIDDGSLEKWDRERRRPS